MATLQEGTTTAQDSTTRSASELAGLIARGDLSAVEVVEAHIARIEAVNPALNAVVVKCYDAARTEAREADARRTRGEALGPLHGVPVTIKESLGVAGTPSTFGLQSLAGNLATGDETHVARLRRAGAIVLGKTNVAQALFYFESDNPVYGRTNNPWNLDRTPGGSSGGEAAIIAAGGSALGLGTDIGGSVRVPATFCGLASIKPTAGRTPDPGRHSVPVGQRAIVSQVGVLARTVADVALGLEVINDGPNPAVEPPMPLGDLDTVDVSRLRVAYFTDDGTFTVAPAVRRTVREAADILRGLGAQVTAWTPPDGNEALDLVIGIFGGDRVRGIKALTKGGKAAPQIAQLAAVAGMPRAMIVAVQRLLRSLGQPSMARGLNVFGYGDTAHYWGLVEAQLAYQERFMAALDRDAGGPFDVILSPGSSLPAFTHGATADLITAGGYTTLYNLLGYPAGIVPVTRVRADEETERPQTRDRVLARARGVELGSAGLPIGVQVAARPWREHVALAAMRAIEGVARTRKDFPMGPEV